jgi:hypothetical protein
MRPGPIDILTFTAARRNPPVPAIQPGYAHIFTAGKTAAMIGVGTALHSLAPKGRGG